MTMPRLSFAAGCLGLALFSACGSSENPKTHDYLSQVVKNIDQMDSDLAALAAPKAAPAMPEIPATVTAPEEKLPYLRHYQDDLIKYLGTLGKAVEQVSGICDKAQAQAGALNSIGVDQQATELGSKYEGLIDRRQQLAVQMAGLVADQANEIRAGRISSLGLRLVAAGTETLFSRSGAAPTGDADDLQAKGNEKIQGGKEFGGIRRAILDWRHDAAAATSAREDLYNSLKAKYPKQDWSFLASKG
jgi:hypothetical protein